MRGPRPTPTTSTQGFSDAAGVGGMMSGSRLANNPQEIRVAQTLNHPPSMPVVLRIRPILEMDESQFFALCQQNQALRLERTAEGDLIFRKEEPADAASHLA